MAPYRRPTAAPVPPRLDEAIGYNIDHLSNLLRRHFIRALRRYGLTPEQWQVIAALRQRGGVLTQTEVARITARDRPTISRMLGRMARDGWIVRMPDPGDGRAFRIQLSERAEAEYEAILATLWAAFQPVFSALSPREEAIYLQLTKRLIARLQP